MESIFLSGNGINTRWTNKDTVITFCTILMNRPHLILSKTPQHPAIISHPFTQDQLCGADSNFRGRYIWRPRGGVTPVHVVNMSHLKYRPETQWKNNSCAFWSRDIQSVSTHFRCVDMMSNRDWPCKTKKVTMWIHSTLLLPILYHRKVWVLGWSEVEIEDGSTASRWTKNCCHYILYQVLKNRPQAHFVLSKTPERYVCVVHSTHTYRSIVHAVYITCTTHNTRCACDLCSVYIISHDVPLPTLYYLGPYWFQQPVLLWSIPLSISGARCVMDEETQTQGYNKRYK